MCKEDCQICCIPWGQHWEVTRTRSFVGQRDLWRRVLHIERKYTNDEIYIHRSASNLELERSLSHNRVEFGPFRERGLLLLRGNVVLFVCGEEEGEKKDWNELLELNQALLVISRPSRMRGFSVSSEMMITRIIRMKCVFLSLWFNVSFEASRKGTFSLHFNPNLCRFQSRPISGKFVAQNGWSSAVPSTPGWGWKALARDTGSRLALHAWLGKGIRLSNAVS